MDITQDMVEDWVAVAGPFMSKRKWKKRKTRFEQRERAHHIRRNSKQANTLGTLAESCFEYFIDGEQGLYIASMRVRDYLHSMTIHRERHARCKPVVRFHRHRFEYRSKSIPSYPLKCLLNNKARGYTCSRCLGYAE